MERRTSRVSIEHGVQKYEARGTMEMRIVERVLNMVLEEVLREENRFPVNFGSKRFERFKLYKSAELQQSSRESILYNRRIDSAEARVDSTFEIGLKERVDSSSSELILKGDERVVLEKVRTVVVRDMYWTGRVGYDNRPGAGSSLESGEARCMLLRSRLSGGLSSFHCVSPGELEHCG
ncbi:hypothetical protein PIB30_100912 [Stylosanthes scabra]|uniref:Uncharacterized protein n=1 Tax=Stylosanthes scabra TaxID=79078 RepID=A0ABU6TWS6_9FABA|nr:hypothetical protein [Stylosanthes scabra]